MLLFNTFTNHWGNTSAWQSCNFLFCSFQKHSCPVQNASNVVVQPEESTPDGITKLNLTRRYGHALIQNQLPPERSGFWVRFRWHQLFPATHRSLHFRRQISNSGNQIGRTSEGWTNSCWISRLSTDSKFFQEAGKIASGLTLETVQQLCNTVGGGGGRSCVTSEHKTLGIEALGGGRGFKIH